MRTATVLLGLAALLSAGLPAGIPAAQAPPAPAALSSGASPQELAALENRIPELMRAGDVPGLSAAIVQDGAVLWSRSFGVRDVESRAPVGDDTIFEAASLSKPVFAYAVAKLVDAGKLDLDTPLTKYLPGDYVDDERIRRITARQVLSHTAGFPNWRPDGQPLRIHLAPGERFSYSGEGFVYLQKAVERITGQTLEAVMERLVFGPLKMTNSSYTWEVRFEGRKARGHSAVGDPLPLRRPAEAVSAASLETTALDYARFLIAVLDGRGLDRKTASEMFRPQIHVDEACQNCILKSPSGHLSREIAWGLGWGLQETAGGASFWHWGDNGSGYHAYVLGYPARRLGMVIFTNGLDGLGIIPEIVQTAIGGRQPAFAWIDYERYDSPARTLFREILAQGEPAIAAYRARRGASAAAALTEQQINRIGYWLLGKKKLAEAVAVLEMNTVDFPDSWNAWDSLGEAYADAGRRDRAVASYEKSLSLNPKNENGIEALRKLKSQAPAGH